MAWNEPGGNNRDPWGSNGRDQGPPDLDELLRKLSNRFGGLFGSGKPGSGSGGPRFSFTGLILIAVLLLGGWLLTGFYIVEQGWQGVETRFGKYTETTEPGLRYHLPNPIENVERVNVQVVRDVEIGYRSAGTRSVLSEALMLTSDENIVDVRLSVQYVIKEPKLYLFNVESPDLTLRQTIESTTREVVGRSTMDFVLTEGRSELVAEVNQLSQDILDQYQTGQEIIRVNLQDAQPPEEVQDAFADAIKAREDEQRVINEAEAYSNEVLPLARGEVARLLQEAEGYRAEVVARSEGEASRFEQLLVEYSKAPQVTRERLYLEAMEEVLDRSNVLLMGAKDNNNLMLLPLDQMLENNNSARSSTSPIRLQNSSASSSSQPLSPQSELPSTSRSRDSSRTRTTR